MSIIDLQSENKEYCTAKIEIEEDYSRELLIEEQGSRELLIEEQYSRELLIEEQDSSELFFGKKDTKIKNDFKCINNFTKKSKSNNYFDEYTMIIRKRYEKNIEDSDNKICIIDYI